MKKLLAAIFTLAFALSIAIPTFAQDTGTQEAPAKTENSMKKEKKMKKHHMMKKEKKMKKDKMEKKAGQTSTPPQK